MTQQFHYWAYTLREPQFWKTVYPSVHCSAMNSSQDMGATWMSINRWMHKEDVLPIHNGILAIKRHESESVLVRWMNLEPVIQNEVSQNEKQILCIEACIWSQEKWYWWAYLQGWKREAEIQNGLVDTVGKGEGGTNGESSIDILTYTLCTYGQSCLTLYHPRDCSPSCVKQIASERLLYNTGNPTWCSVMT